MQRQRTKETRKTRVCARQRSTPEWRRVIFSATTARVPTLPILPRLKLPTQGILCDNVPLLRRVGGPAEQAVEESGGAEERLLILLRDPLRVPVSNHQGADEGARHRRR